VIMAAIQLVNELRTAPVPPAPETRKRSLSALGYFFTLILFLSAILLVGFGIATALFTFIFLIACVRLRWQHALLYTACLVGVVLVMSQLLNLYWPGGILFGP